LLLISITQDVNGFQEIVMLNLKTQARLKRKKRIRKKMVGTENRPRLCVFRSAKHIYAQVIDDSRGYTISAASSVEKTVRENPESKNKVTTANIVGKILGRRALEKGVAKVVFDRNGFLYHGRVKAVSEGAREAGLDF
jgi:large subunit ribosomal protein L18